MFEILVRNSRKGTSCHSKINKNFKICHTWVIPSADVWVGPNKKFTYASSPLTPPLHLFHNHNDVAIASWALMTDRSGGLYSPLRRCWPPDRPTQEDETCRQICSSDGGNRIKPCR